MLPKLPSLQSAWLLLYYCAVPRLNHLLRTLPPTIVQYIATQHDPTILDTFQRLFGISTCDSWDQQLHGVAYDTWILQAQLPLRMGGMGLRNSSRTAPATYWASWADVVPDLLRRFPAIGRNILHHLTAYAAGAHVGPYCLQSRQRMGRTTDVERSSGRGASPRTCRTSKLRAPATEEGNCWAEPSATTTRRTPRYDLQD